MYIRPMMWDVGMSRTECAKTFHFVTIFRGNATDDTVRGVACVRALTLAPMTPSIRETASESSDDCCLMFSPAIPNIIILARHEIRA